MPESRHRRRHGRALPRAARSTGSLITGRPKRKRPNKLYFVASALIAVLVIASFAFAGLSGGGQGGIGSATGSDDQFVEGVGEQQQLMATGSGGVNVHVAVTQNVDYNTAPATSGNHWDTPTACGFYGEGIPDERIVHNLEHGNIIVSYNLSDQAQVDQLRSAFDEVGLANVWGILRSYDQIPDGQVALAAWGVLDVMQGIDPARIETFFNTYAGNLGPEEVTCLGIARQQGQ